MTDGIVLDTLEQAQTFFQKDRYATDSGMVIAAAGLRSSVIRLRVDARHKNAVGGLMGGVLLTMADFACAVASNFGTDTGAYVSADAHMSFLSACRGNELTAEATCVKQGGRLAFYEVAITDELQTPVARASFTMCRVK